MKPLYNLAAINLAVSKLSILFVHGTNLQIKLSHSLLFLKANTTEINIYIGIMAYVQSMKIF